MESKFIIESIADDVRVDGRSRLEQRDFSLKLSVNSQARGSSQVWLGETCVVCFLYSDIAEMTQQQQHQQGEGDEGDEGEQQDQEGHNNNNNTNNNNNQKVLSISAKVTSVSDDVDTNSIRTLASDLSLLYRNMSESCQEDLVAVASRIISCSGGGGGGEEDNSNHNNEEEGEGRTRRMNFGGIGIKLTAELSILCGSGGNVLSAASLAVKSALWNATMPCVHVVLSSDGVTASSVEIDEQRRESIAAIGLSMPVAIKAIATGTGFYCVDPCREEETAGAFESVVGVQLQQQLRNNNNHNNLEGENNNNSSINTTTAASAATEDNAITSNNNNNNNNNQRNKKGEIVFSRIHSSRSSSSASSSSSSNSKSDLSVSDVLTILSESASAGEKLHSMWLEKLS